MPVHLFHICTNYVHISVVHYKCVFVNQELKKAEDVGSQSEAWKTYMKEVKELQEKCCSDKEGHKRPLVK